MFINRDGIRISVVPDTPRYSLPAEVLPGVPWPAGFRDHINTWARGYFRSTNIIPDGQCIVLPGDEVVCSPRTYAALREIS